ncbi:MULTISPECIES: hypothetical protein [unclassified Blastococcus]
MGRHAAAVGADVDPVVAAALARRGVAGGTPRHTDAGDERRGGERQENPVGWPGRDDEAPGGSPVGWPGSITAEPAERAPERPAATPTPERPRGWRRLFGGSRAA